MVMLGRTVATAAAAHPALLLLLARPAGRRGVGVGLHHVSRLQWLRYSSYPALRQAARQQQPDNSSTTSDEQHRADGGSGGGGGSGNATNSQHRLASDAKTEITTDNVRNEFLKISAQNISNIPAGDPGGVATDVRNIEIHERQGLRDSSREHGAPVSSVDSSRSCTDRQSNVQDSTRTPASSSLTASELTIGAPAALATGSMNQDDVSIKDGVSSKDGVCSEDGCANTTRSEPLTILTDSSSSLPPLPSQPPIAPDEGAKSKPTGELNSVMAKEPKPKGVLGYMITRYTWYIDKLQQSLENEMPRTFKMFRIFNVGIKAFAKDFVGLVRVLVKLSFPTQRLESLSLQQLELYHFMPWDMFKVFPVLAVSAVPFGQNVALPFGYLFPRQLLCRHFWDLQQNHDFAMRQLQSQVYSARPVFRCIQAGVETIEQMGARVRAQAACHMLGSGVHPSTAQVLDLRPLFQEQPYGLSSIKRHHVKSLLRLHGLSGLMGGRRRLRDHARWLRCHDIALLAPPPPSDGEASTPTTASGAATTAGDCSGQQGMAAAVAAHHVNCLKTALLLRGISPLGLDSSAMVELLLRWLSVSSQLQPQDASLLLHLPVLLFYNYPANMALRY